MPSKFGGRDILKYFCVREKPSYEQLFFRGFYLTKIGRREAVRMWKTHGASVGFDNS